MKSENYLCLGGKRIDITEDKLQEIKNALRIREQFTITQNDKGEQIATVGKLQFLVLKQTDDCVHLILKDLYKKNVQFGKKNDFRGSNVQQICREFADDLAKIVGDENIVEHTVDLTSDDGLKDYGVVTERVSLLTTNQYREFVNILDLDRLDAWYWLVTPYSTPSHEDAEWVKCVSPLGGVNFDYYNGGYGGVRPFCILKSDIFIS